MQPFRHEKGTLRSLDSNRNRSARIGSKEENQEDGRSSGPCSPVLDRSPREPPSTGRFDPI